MKAGETVYIRDPNILAQLMKKSKPSGSEHQPTEPIARSPYREPPDIFLRFTLTLPPFSDSESRQALISTLPSDFNDIPFYKRSNGEVAFAVDAIASTATFGGNPSRRRNDDLNADASEGWSPIESQPLLFGPESHHNGKISLIRAESSNADGCEDHHPGLRFGYNSETSLSSDSSQGDNSKHKASPATVLFVRRGGCTFFHKLAYAKEAGFAGVIVWNAQDEPNDRTNGGLINPSAEPDEVVFAAKELNDVSVVVLAREDGQYVDAVISLAEAGRDLEVGSGEIMVEVFRDAPAGLVEDNTENTMPENAYVERERTLDEVVRDGEKTGDRILYINGLALKNTILY